MLKFKYCFKVFDFESGTQIAQVICPVDRMLDTIKDLSSLGIVKGFILDDKESEEF